MVSIHSVRITAIACVVASLVASCGDEDGDSSQSLGGSARGGRGEWGGAREEAAIPIKTATVARGDISSYIETHARLQAERWVIVIARTQGTVEELLVEEGDWVDEDRVLVRLEKAELSLRVQQAEVALEQAQATHARRAALFERQMVSEEEYEGARNQLANAEVDLKEARLNLAYADIRAPIAGMLMQRNIEIGDLVRTNQEVFVVADLDPLLARIHIPEKRVRQVSVGQRAEIAVAGNGEEIFDAKVRMINPGIDPQSGTVKVTLEVSDRRSLKPGMFVTVRLITDVHAATLVIPKKALVLETDADDVFVVQGGRAQRRSIELGYVSGDQVEVVRGLELGEEVITIGQQGLKDSAAVRVVGSSAQQMASAAVKSAQESASGSGGRGPGGFGGGRFSGDGAMPDSAAFVKRVQKRRGFSEEEAVAAWQRFKTRFAARSADSTQAKTAPEVR